jgi:YD repeat-containing protein
MNELPYGRQRPIPRRSHGMSFLGPGVRFSDILETAAAAKPMCAVGNLSSKTDRKNQRINYTYDQLNRLTQKAYPDNTAVNYTYDNDSRLMRVTDPTGTYQFTFDNMGRLAGTTTQYAFLPTRTFPTSYTYDAASNRVGFTDPEGGANTYAYDALNRLQTLTPPAAISSGSFGFSYDALSRRTQMTRPNNVTTNYSYDNLSRLLSVLHQAGGNTIDGRATRSMPLETGPRKRTSQRV